MLFPHYYTKSEYAIKTFYNMLAVCLEKAILCLKRASNIKTKALRGVPSSKRCPRRFYISTNAYNYIEILILNTSKIGSKGVSFVLQN